MPRDKHPNEVAGSALDAVSPHQVDIEARAFEAANSVKAMADAVKAGQTEDTKNSLKFPRPGGLAHYLMGGILSAVPEDGNFKFSNDSPKPSIGSLQVNQLKGEFTSSGSKTKLGSLDVSTLTNDRINIGSAKQASSNITPQRSWVKTLFPNFHGLGVSNFIMLMATSKVLSAASKEFFTDQTVIVSDAKTRKDLGTLIVDHQDFELSILNGDI